MKVCHVITRLIVGGAQENTVLTCRGLVERGHDVSLIAGPETGPEGSLWEVAQASGVQLFEVPTLRRSIKPTFDWRSYKSLIRHFKRIRPDIVHTHSSKAGIVARLAAAKAKIPVIIHTIHGMSFNRTQPWYLRNAFARLERLAAKHTHKIIAVADAMIDQSVKTFVAERKRFITIRSGMEVEQFSPDPHERREIRKRWQVNDEDVLACTIARFFKNKGYEELLQAMPQATQANKRLKFVWIGGGAHRAKYEAQLNHLGLRNRVIMTGLIQPEEVGQYIQGCDMVVHASRWEGLPRALVQGSLAGLPTISFDNDGAPEVVLNQKTGLLVPYGNTESLAQAMIELAGDSTLRAQLGQTGRSLCMEKFDWRKMVEQIDKLYKHAQNGDYANRRRD